MHHACAPAHSVCPRCLPPPPGPCTVVLAKGWTRVEGADGFLRPVPAPALDLAPAVLQGLSALTDLVLAVERKPLVPVVAEK